MTSILGSRYARALAELVFSPGSQIKPDDVVQQLRAIEALIGESHQLRAILLSPAVITARKTAVMRKLMSGIGISPVVERFLFVLIAHQRITHLAEVRASFEAIVDQHNGVVRAEVTSAEPLDEAQTHALQVALNEVSGKLVRMKTSVDASLLGGVVARIGSTVYDGSVRGQLESMRRRLSSESAN